VRRKTSRIRIAYERADVQARSRQLREDVAADVACDAGDEDSFHNGHCIGLRRIPHEGPIYGNLQQSFRIAAWTTH
jgi:hypothetical protein